MKIKNTLGCCVLVAGALFAVDGMANEEEEGGGAKINPQRFWFDGRLRLETVSQDNVVRDASAITLRSRVGFSSGDLNDFEFLIEGENILALQDDYNSTTNGETNRSVVPDPEDTELNRLFLRYEGFEDNQIVLGRQRLLFDDARFIGNVAWRQNEQTFDALSIRNTSFDSTIIEVAYVDTVRRIFGPDSPVGSTDMSSPLIHVQYQGFRDAELSVYGYFLDFDDAPATSNQTLGFRYKGKYSLSERPLDYLVEYARQSDYRGGADVIDAFYLHTAVGVKVADARVGVDYNILSGDGNYGFQTPLATAHAFNGWADLFLTTPAAGLQDFNVSLSGQFRGFKLRGVYHWFSADQGSADYGSEFNFIATRKFGDRVSAGLKFADYTADQFGVDTTKFWLWAGLTY